MIPKLNEVNLQAQNAVLAAKMSTAGADAAGLADSPVVSAMNILSKWLSDHGVLPSVDLTEKAKEGKAKESSK